MNFFHTRNIPWRGLALIALLCYPVMASSHLPFGGGARYMSVLAAPICLMLIAACPRSELLTHARSALSWSLPFIPMVLGWLIARVWHGYDPIDLTPLSRLLLAALLFIGARQLGVQHWQLGYAAAFGAIACGLIASIEVFALGRARAWGGVYENRFAQYSIWFAVLCMLHAIRFSKEGGRSIRLWLLIGAIPVALLGTLLTGSRGALLALPISVIIAVTRSFSWRRALLFTLAGLALCTVFVLIYEPFRLRTFLAYQEFIAYFEESTFRGTSVGIRLELARVALLSMSVDPWLGVGYQSLSALYAQYPQLLGLMPESLASIPSFHSDWFHAIGIGGLMLMSALLLSVIWLFVVAKQDIYRTCFVICALVFSVSEMFFWHKMGLSLLISTWALYSAAEESR